MASEELEMILFKVLDDKGRSCNGGELSWSLPEGEKPGEWMERVENPMLGVRGYHLCRPDDLIQWLGPRIYLAEIQPGAVTIEHDDKIVTSGPVRLLRKCPWDERTARLFGADCVEHVIHFYEDDRPGDVTLRWVLDVARDRANGKASGNEVAAACDSAWGAAALAASDAACSLGSPPSAWWTARAAARSAARDAGDAAWTARAAARAASLAAGEDAERAWQTKDASDSAWAASLAARVAARAASDAACDARAAALDARTAALAGAAGEAAERAWQTKRLMKALGF